MKPIALILLLLVAPAPAGAQDGALGPGLRGGTPLAEEARPPLIPKVINDDRRRVRAFPMQPPVIPHHIDNYQVDRYFNRCMSCHARERIEDSGAPMVSVTHYVDRDGAHRSEIAPGRYFCTQCHVPQADIQVPVRNTFQDAASLPASRPDGNKR